MYLYIDNMTHEGTTITWADCKRERKGPPFYSGNTHKGVHYICIWLYIFSCSMRLNMYMYSTCIIQACLKQHSYTWAITGHMTVDMKPNRAGTRPTPSVMDISSSPWDYSNYYNYQLCYLNYFKWIFLCFVEHKKYSFKII